MPAQQSRGRARARMETQIVGSVTATPCDFTEGRFAFHSLLVDALYNHR